MSLVPCECIDDTNRPSQIPVDKWVVKGEKYRILSITIHLKQNRIQGVALVEKPLDESNDPFRAFKLSRFAFRKEDIPALLQLAKDCTELKELNEAEDLAAIEELLNKEIRELETVEQ